MLLGNIRVFAVSVVGDGRSYEGRGFGRETSPGCLEYYTRPPLSTSSPLTENGVFLLSTRVQLCS